MTLTAKWCTRHSMSDVRNEINMWLFCHKDKMTNLLQYCLLSPNVERIFPGEKSCPGGGADLLTVGLLQSDTSLCQSLHVAGWHVRVVPGHVVPPKVVGQDEDNIWLLFLSSN